MAGFAAFAAAVSTRPTMNGSGSDDSAPCSGDGPRDSWLMEAVGSNPVVQALGGEPQERQSQPQEQEVLPHMRLNSEFLVRVFGSARESEAGYLAGGTAAKVQDSLNRGGQIFNECSAKAQEVVQKGAVADTASLLQRVDVEDTVRENRSRMRGCSMMLFAGALFTSFTAANLMREDIARGYLLQFPLHDRLSQGLEDIHAIPDVWTWIETVYVPTLFQQRDMYGKLLPESEWGRVLTYGQLRGVVVLSQTRSVKQKCDDALAKNLWCYPQQHLSVEPFGPALSEQQGPGATGPALLPGGEGSAVEGTEGGDLRRQRISKEGFHLTSPSGAPTDQRFRVLLHRRSPLAELQRRLRRLRAHRWLDEQSLRLSFRALVLSAEGSRPQLMAVAVDFDFSRGGGVLPQVRLDEVSLRPLATISHLAIHLCFVVVLLLCTAFMIHQLFLVARSGRAKRHCLKPATISAWVVLMLLWVHFGCSILIDHHLRKDVISALEALQDIEGAGIDEDGPGPSVEAAALKLHEVADALVLFSWWFHTLSSGMVLLLMVRAFMALEFQPRLAVVLKTLKMSAIDLAYFLVLLVPTFVAFAIAGMCLFGRRVDDFSSFGRAIGTCFKIAIESEFEWVQMSDEDPFTAGIWVVSYTLLLVLLILNMVLAIIMDVYSEIRHSVRRHESILESCAFLMQRLKRWRCWVPGEVLLKHLQGLPRVFSIEELELSLYTRFPDIVAWQVGQLVTKARSKATHKHFSASQEEQFRMKTIAAMSVASSRAHESLQRILPDDRSEADVQSDGSKQWKRAQVQNKSHKQRSDITCREDVLQSVAVQNHWLMILQEQLEQIRAFQHPSPKDVIATQRLRRDRSEARLSDSLDSAGTAVTVGSVVRIQSH